MSSDDLEDDNKYRRLGFPNSDTHKPEGREEIYYKGYIDGMARAYALIAKLNTPQQPIPDTRFRIMIESLFDVYGAENAVSILKLIETIGPAVICK